MCSSNCDILLSKLSNAKPEHEHEGIEMTRKLSYCKDDRTMRPMYGCPENFQESLTTPTATSPEFLMGFCSD